MPFVFWDNLAGGNEMPFVFWDNLAGGNTHIPLHDIVAAHVTFPLCAFDHKANLRIIKRIGGCVGCTFIPDDPGLPAPAPGDAC